MHGDQVWVGRGDQAKLVSVGAPSIGQRRADPLGVGAQERLRRDVLDLGVGLAREPGELFEHLVDVAQSSYASALGRTRQQDLVRAQLEL